METFAFLHSGPLEMAIELISSYAKCFSKPRI